MILILSGPVASGKTTFLQKWASKHNDVCGLLSPVDPNLGRVFVDLVTGQVVPMETTNPTEKALVVGRYRFSQNAFHWADDTLRKALVSPHSWLIIDEIGPLELSGRGLDPVARWILDSSLSGKNVVLVVREKLIDEVIHHYALNRDGVVVSWPTKTRRAAERRSKPEKTKKIERVD